MKRPKPVPISGETVFDTILGDLKTVSQSQRESLPLDKIVPRQQQPRRFFAKDRIQALAASIEEVGLLEPLIVRPLGDSYEIVAGERRYQALRHLGVERADVVIKDFDDKAAFLASAVENLNREDLHPLEETDAVLSVLEASLNIGRKEVIQLITRARTLQRLATGYLGNSAVTTDGAKDQTRNASDSAVTTDETEEREQGAGNSAVTNEMPPEIRHVLELLHALGIPNVSSFYTHRLPLLEYPEDLLEAMRNGTLDFTKAKQLVRLPQHERAVLMQKIREGMTLRDLEREVAKLLKGEKRPQPQLLEDFKALKRVVTTKRVQELDADKQQKLKALLQEINTLFNAEP